MQEAAVVARRFPAAAVAVWLALGMGAAATALGLSRMEWPGSLPTQDEGLLRYGIVFLGATLLLRAWIQWTRFTAAAGVALAAAVLALLSGNAAALVPCILLPVAFTLTGHWLCRGLGLAAGERMRPIDCLLAGAGAYGTIIALTAAWPVHYPGVYAAALLLPVALGWNRLRGRIAARPGLICQLAPAPEGQRWLEALTGALVLVYVAVALLPEIGHDALAMHLFLANQMQARHAWTFDAGTYVWAVMPMLANWIFGLAHQLGGEAAARLVNVGFIVVLAGLVREACRWARGDEAGARWASLLFLSMPLAFTEGSSLFVESVWASFAIAGILAMLRACAAHSDVRAELPLAGLFLGLAMAAKAITLTVLPALAAVLVWRHRAWWTRAGARVLGLAAGLFILFGAAPYVSAWRRTGNPVFPFFNQVFQSPLFIPQNFESASVFGRGLNWSFPYDVTFQSQRYLESLAGSGGFQWLLVIVPALVAVALARNRRAAALAFIAFASLAIAFMSVSYLRYVFPSLALMCAVGGVAVSGGTRRPGLSAGMGIAAAAAVALNVLFIGAASPYRNFPLDILGDAGARQEWIEAERPIRRAAAAVNGLNAARSPVAILARDSAMGADLNADALLPTWYNARFRDGLAAQQTIAGLASFFHGYGVDYIVLSQAWPQRQRVMVEQMTDRIVAFGDLSVRRLTDGYRYPLEQVQDPKFEDARVWTLAGGAVRKEDGMHVSAAAPAFQRVAVAPRRRYLNAATVTCARPGFWRLQVNWLDAASNFIKSDIQVVGCTAEPLTYGREVTAPARATQAVVYASGHTSDEVVFAHLSLRQ